MKFYLGNVGKLEDVELLKEHGMGTFLTATAWRSPKPGLPYALDNGAYSHYLHGTEFDEKRFDDFLSRHLQLETRPDFAVCPDIVAGGLGSFAFSLQYRMRLTDEIDWYLAVQDGMCPWDLNPVLWRFSGIFIGGTVLWKTVTGPSWVKLARAHGKKVHIGRCGTPSRIRWAVAIGADSADSTTPACDFSEKLPELLKALAGVDDQARLFEDTLIQ